MPWGIHTFLAINPFREKKKRKKRNPTYKSEIRKHRMMSLRNRAKRKIMKTQNLAVIAEAKSRNEDVTQAI